MRTLSLILLGAVLWFLGAAFIRLALPYGLFSGGYATAILFGVTALLAPVLLSLAHRLTAGGKTPRLPTAAILCLVGVLLDAVAMTWSPELYASNPARLVGGAAWLLFGVGALLTSAMLQDRTR
ncbi:hypothetical protein JKL49_03570 [Phenylobacterium sp. 20VBR1]|uniref:Uncharacterized protein n=1 Tax=Phenylobacterium glaciei TaxID=2803784 RepID=A0A941D193_9CAUL|nr:hypothetical protein [Phenylobacterium glaciei]MBR7618458.1 hypothetical protein [Phenylobacterium glaciei]